MLPRDYVVWRCLCGAGHGFVDTVIMTCVAVAIACLCLLVKRLRISGGTCYPNDQVDCPSYGGGSDGIESIYSAIVMSGIRGELMGWAARRGKDGGQWNLLPRLSSIVC